MIYSILMFEKNQRVFHWLQLTFEIAISDCTVHLDLAVGSYSSGHVVVLHSSPVAEIEATLGTNITGISNDEVTTEFSVVPCFHYKGKSVPKTIGKP